MVPKNVISNFNLHLCKFAITYQQVAQMKYRNMLSLVDIGIMSWDFSFFLFLDITPPKNDYHMNL
jgi:hypothetical protein